MSDKPQDTLDKLRSYYLGEAEEHESRAAYFRKKLAQLDEMEGDMAEIESTQPSPATNGRFKGKGLSDAALEAVNMLGVDGAQAGAIRKLLLSQGFVPGGKNFVVSSITALNRLAESGKIKSELKEGRRLYMKK